VTAQIPGWSDPGVAPALHMQPFVLPVAEALRRREGTLDVYRPAGSDGELRPVIVFVHGGPLPPDLQPTPRDWPIYRGYGALATSWGWSPSRWTTGCIPWPTTRLPQPTSPQRCSRLVR
jgi:hypothetical protein